MVAHVPGRRQSADHCDRPDRSGIERQDPSVAHRFVLEQDHRPGGHGTSQSSGVLVGHDVRRRVVRDTPGVRSELGRQEADAGPIDHPPRRLTGRDLVAEVQSPLLTEGLLQVHSGVEGQGAVTHPPDEVRDRDAVPVPLVPQHRCQQMAVLPAPRSVHGVVRRHDGGHVLVDDPLEVRQVDIVENRLVHRDVHGKAGVLHLFALRCQSADSQSTEGSDRAFRRFREFARD